MTRDKWIMVGTAIASILCAFWAYSVPANGTAIALCLNAVISLIIAYKI